MKQAKRILVLLSMAMLLPLMPGCGGGKHLDLQSMGESGKIAVVSVVMPRVADVSREANRAVLQAAVNRAFEGVTAGLAGVHNWTVTDPVKERKGKAVPAFAKVSDVDLAALFPVPEERARVAAVVPQELSRWKAAFLGAEGLPVVPRRAFVADDEGSQPEGAVQQVMLQEAGKFCVELKVDAVAFVHLRASITHPRESAFIVSDGRTDGMLRMAATLVVVDKTGRIIVDRGWPALDDSARTKDLLPLYKGAGKDFVKDENIDLGDSRKKIAQAFAALTDEAVSDLIADLKSAAGK